MSTAVKPPVPMTPETAAMALAMPLVQTFAAEIVKLTPDAQQKRIAKVLAAMRGDA